MTTGRIRQKWRPTLALVLGFTLATVLCLPMAGIIAVRLLVPLIGYQRAVIAVAVLVVLVVAGVGWTLWRVLLRPIQTLAARTVAVKSGAPGALLPLEHYGTVEMQALGQAMLDMGRVLQGREAVLRSYADHATHELKSPLTVMRGAAELLAGEGLGAQDRERLVGRIDQAAERMTALLDAQRMLARAQEPFVTGRTRLGRLMPGLQAEHPGLQLILNADAEQPMAADGLRLVLGHLLGNAASHGATQVQISATLDGFDVADNGPGVSEGNRARIFDPFFTTRREGGGTGMGLPIVRRMLQAHGGDIGLAPGTGGARFVVTF